MRHRLKKIKFRGGKDANKMLVRKLAVNFFEHGKITTTRAKAKVLTSFLEKICYKIKQETEANKNYLFKKLGNGKTIKTLFKEIGPAIKAKTSGHIKKTNLGMRLSDGSEMMKLEWSIPVVLENKKTVKTPTKTVKAVKKVDEKNK